MEMKRVREIKEEIKKETVRCVEYGALANAVRSKNDDEQTEEAE